MEPFFNPPFNTRNSILQKPNNVSFVTYEQIHFLLSVVSIVSHKSLNLFTIKLSLNRSLTFILFLSLCLSISLLVTAIRQKGSLFIPPWFGARIFEFYDLDYIVWKYIFERWCKISLPWNFIRIFGGCATARELISYLEIVFLSSMNWLGSVRGWNLQEVSKEILKRPF